jgi:hypothetical protein
MGLLYNGAMGLKKIAVLTLWASVPAAGVPVQPGFDRQAWLADYAALKAAMERSQSHLAWLASPGAG